MTESGAGTVPGVITGAGARNVPGSWGGTTAGNKAEIEPVAEWKWQQRLRIRMDLVSHYNCLQKKAHYYNLVLKKQSTEE